MAFLLGDNNRNEIKKKDFFKKPIKQDEKPKKVIFKEKTLPPIKNEKTNKQKTECPTVFGYFGGKFSMSKKLVNWIPKHNQYIELFAGGLSMFFRKKKANWNLINDLNSDITNLYYVVSQPELYNDFKHQVYFLCNSRKFYEMSSKILKTPFVFPNVRRAVWYLYHVSTSFNKILDTGFAVNHNNWNTTILNSLQLSREKLNNTIIENKDYKDIVSAHKEKKDVFWFIDPPYVVADTKKYYKYNFDSMKDHKELKEQIDMIIKDNDKQKEKANIMVTYDNLPEIRALYDYPNSPYQLHNFKTTYSSNGKETTELIVTNYDLPNQPLELF